MKLIPTLVEAMEKNQLKCIKELYNTASFSCMTALEKRNEEQVEKIRFMLPHFK